MTKITFEVAFEIPFTKFRNHNFPFITIVFCQRFYIALFIYMCIINLMYTHALLFLPHGREDKVCALTTTMLLSILQCIATQFSFRPSHQSGFGEEFCQATRQERLGILFPLPGLC